MKYYNLLLSRSLYSLHFFNIILLKPEKWVYWEFQRIQDREASQKSQREGQLLFGIRKKLGRAFFFFLSVLENTFKVMTASYWLQAEFSAFLLGQGKLFRFQKTRDKISLRKKFSFVLEVTFF